MPFRTTFVVLTVVLALLVCLFVASDTALKNKTVSFISSTFVATLPTSAVAINQTIVIIPLKDLNNIVGSSSSSSSLSATTIPEENTIFDKKNLVIGVDGTQLRLQVDANSNSNSNKNILLPLKQTQPSVPLPPQTQPSSLESIYSSALNETFAPLAGVESYPEARRLPRARGPHGWQHRLFTPTYVGFHLGFWWIVDCWHHRVLYRKRQPDETDADLDKEKDFVNGWKKLKVANESWMVIPHSIASDGKSIIMIETSIGGSSDGTEHSILVFELLPKDHPIRTFRAAKNSDADFVKQMEFDVAGSLNVYTEADDFVLVQRLLACPPPRQEVRRPHRLVFDAGIRAFFLYITTPGALARFNLVFSSRTKISSTSSSSTSSVTFHDTPFQTNQDDDLRVKEEDLAEEDSRASTLGQRHNISLSANIKSPKFSPITLSELQQEDMHHLRQHGRIKPRVEFDYCKILQFMKGSYARSIAIVGTKKKSASPSTTLEFSLYITLGPGVVSRIAHRQITKFTRRSEIVPTATFSSREWKIRGGSMNDLFFHNNWWYITQTNKCSMYRVRQLQPSNFYMSGGSKSKSPRRSLPPEYRLQVLLRSFSLCSKKQLGRTDRCTGGGSPYFMSRIGHRIYFTYIFGCSGIQSFVPTQNASSSTQNTSSQIVEDAKHHFDSNQVGWWDTADDIVRRGPLW